MKEEEALLTEHKAHTFKQEMDRLRESHIKTEKEKAELEKQIRDAEFCVVHLTEEKDKRAAEADKLKNELCFARERERDATRKLLNFLSRSVAQCSMESISSPNSNAESPIFDADLTSCDLIMASGDMQQITNEIEKNRYVASFLSFFHVHSSIIVSYSFISHIASSIWRRPNRSRTNCAHCDPKLNC